MTSHRPRKTKPCSNTIAPETYAAQLQSAISLHRQGLLVEAAAGYREILKLQPDHFDALQLFATIALQKKSYEEALVLFDQAITINASYPVALNNRGITLKELARYEEAVESYDKAIALKSDYAEAYSNRSNALKELSRYEEALVSVDEAIALKPDYVEAHYNRGIVLQALNRQEEALASYDEALALKHEYAEAHYNRGNALQELNRYDEALESYDKTIALKPDYAEAYSNCGVMLQELNRHEEALLNYDKAIAMMPEYTDAYANRGNVLQTLNRHEEAVASFERAIAIKPDFFAPYWNRGNSFAALNRYDSALVSYERAIALNPNARFLFGTYFHTKMKICNWSFFESELYQLYEKIENHEKVSTPFVVLAIVDDPSLQQKAAEIYAQTRYPANNELPAIPMPALHDKIRIGYYSADYYDHATAYLMAELFEQHDRSKFELIAFSFGPDRNDRMRKRVTAAFDKFIDVRTMSDKQVAQLSGKLQIDIAVDLKGFTTDSRPRIFAFRAAPIQVNYLGYPGTMGAGYIDYLVADKMLIPASNQQYYTEKIVYLPDSYQVNDAQRHIAEKLFTRKELGLPETGFVFCCFNNNYKITPTTFDCWMRILAQIDGSILWLFEDNATAATNLHMEAAQRGIDADRLIFAKRMPLAEHLARHRQADLFLDTLPYNAHTTASDALWAGLPVLTCMGESFASRVAASLLNAIHLPELITTSPAEYEALAIELATNPEKLGQLKQKLEQNRLTTPLFDTERFTRHLEAAYTAMYERYQKDLPPDHLYIEPRIRGDKMIQLQQEYECCPLCGGGSTLYSCADSTRHPMWHEPLPRTLEWMCCSSCRHVYTRYYWTLDGLKELFSHSHAYQQATASGSLDAKRAIWSPVVDKVLNLLGGYRSLMNAPQLPTWIDVGFGDGALVMTASDFGFSVLGLDARKETVISMQSLGYKARQGDFMSTRFEGALDVLSMMDVLEHMPFPRQVLGKAAEIVRPGGVLVISLPDLSCSSWKMMDIAKVNPYWYEIEHHHNFSRLSLTTLLQENGFDVAAFAIPYRYKAQMEVYAIRLPSSRYDS